MNWVGGVKKRIFEKDRKQEEYFAKYAPISKRASELNRKASPQATVSYNNDASNSNSMQENGDDPPPKEDASDEPHISREGVHITKKLKLTNIHGPFSEMLVKMEHDGAKRKIRKKKQRPGKSHKRKEKL